MTSEKHEELIVLAAPTSSYYNKFREQIIDFHINYAKKIIANNDEVILLCDDLNLDKYIDAIGSNRILNYPMQDIWMRDFTLTCPNNPIMFKYTSAGQGNGKTAQQLANKVQQQFLKLSKAVNLTFTESNLYNDGGNFVDNYAGSVIISKKFLKDNSLTPQVAKQKLKKLGLINIAFIEPDEPEGLQHADGIVSFIEKDIIVINNYQDNKDYAIKLKSDLQQALPKIKIYEIITPYDNCQAYDKLFSSACGLYTNMLVTNTNIYLPQFGILEDKIALEQLKAISSKNIIPIDSSQICKLGGAVRCMSLQLRGDNKDRFLEYVKNSNQ